MNSNFSDRLESEVLIHTGQVSTELAKRGFNLGESNMGFMMAHPDIFQDIMEAFYAAGSNIGTANTGGSNRLRLMEFGLEDKVHEYNVRAVKLAREVTPDDCYLEGVLSGTGHFLKPAGDVSFEEVYEVYQEQLMAILEGGVDIIRMTGHDMGEMKAGLKAIKEQTDLPVIAVVSFNPTSKGYRTMTGLDPKTAAQGLDEAGVDSIGTICGKTSMEDTTDILYEMRSVTQKFLIAKPNAGVPELTGGEPVHPVTPEQMASEVPNWVAAGAKIVGGCCGAGPEHIAAIASVLKDTSKKS